MLVGSGATRTTTDSLARTPRCEYASRLRMQYPSFPMPGSYGDFPHHSEMAAYLGAYADEFQACAHRSGSAPPWSGSNHVGVAGGRSRSTTARGTATARRRRDRRVLVPRLPTYPGSFDGMVSHAHEYRMPEPFAGRRVLVVGAGPVGGRDRGRGRESRGTDVHVHTRRRARDPRWIGREPTTP